MTLIQRFSLICLVALALFGVGLGWIVTTSLEQTMLMRTEKLTARFIAEEVKKEFASPDFVTPKFNSDYEAFSKRIRRVSSGPSVVRTKVWNRERTIVWSDKRELVGLSFPRNEELNEALGGEIVSKIRTLAKAEHKFEREFEKLLELYIPIQFEDHGDIDGVVEIHQNLDPLYADISQQKRIVWGATVLGMAALYFVLFVMVRSASGRVSARVVEVVENYGGRYQKLFIVLICLAAIAAIFGFYEIIEHTWLIHRLDRKTIYLLHMVRGLGTSFLIVLVVVWLLFRRRAPVFPQDEGSAIADNTSFAIDRLRHYSLWFTDMRWFAILAATLLAILACPILQVLPAKVFPFLLICVGSLTGLNIAYVYASHRHPRPYRLLMLQIVTDLFLLTAMLHYSGGLENPLTLFYLFHVIIACIVLEKRTSYLLTLLACSLLTLNVVGELLKWWPHYRLSVFPHQVLHGAVEHGAYDPAFVAGGLGTLVVTFLLTAFFTNLLMDRIRLTEKQRASMAQNAVMEQKKLECVVDAVGAGMVLLSQDFRISWFNRRVREWFGFTDEMIGHIFDPSRWEMRPSGEKLFSMSRSDPSAETPEGEWAIPGDDGRKQFFYITSSAIKNEQGKVTQTVIMIQDVTRQKVIEAEMVHSGKMAVLGRMAAGIAHEIGNPLSSLSTRLRILEKRHDEAFLTQSIDLLRAQIDRIARTVHSISQFARPAEEEWAPCQINDIVSEMLGILEMDRKAKNIDIRFVPVSSLPRTMGVKDQLLQVFLNIAINALEAMPEGGTLSLQSEMSDGNVRVSFRDTGVGIPEEFRPLLFTPFSTTKKDGSGLGLSISYSFVHAHGGRIEVESTLGEGSTFTVVLPIQGNLGRADNA